VRSFSRQRVPKGQVPQQHFRTVSFDLSTFD
jgi:hypothetical protein